MNEHNSANQHQSDAPSQLRLEVGTAEEEVGARLRHQRLKRRISLAEAAGALKLTASTLESIECGELDRFESLYRRGYVRNYARFLGLEPDPLLQMLQQESDLPPLRTVLPVKPGGAKSERFFKLATYAIVTTLIIPPLVLIYIQGGLGFLDRDFSALVDADDGASVIASSGVEPVQRRASPEGSELRDEGSAGPVTASALPLNPIRPVREITSESLAMMLEAGAAEDDETELDVRSTLQVELLDDSWLEVYAADGRRLEFDLLRAGEQRRFVAEAPFRILLGRGSAVSLMLDGEAVRFDGYDRGDVVRFNLSADGVVVQD